MKNFIKNFFKDEDAQGMTEYIIIVVVIALAALTAWRFYGWQLRRKVHAVAESIQNLSSPGGGTGVDTTTAGTDSSGGSTPFGRGF